MQNLKAPWRRDLLAAVAQDTGWVIGVAVMLFALSTLFL